MNPARSVTTDYDLKVLSRGEPVWKHTQDMERGKATEFIPLHLLGANPDNPRTLDFRNLVTSHCITLILNGQPSSFW